MGATPESEAGAPGACVPPRGASAAGSAALPRRRGRPRYPEDEGPEARLIAVERPVHGRPGPPRSSGAPGSSRSPKSGRGSKSAHRGRPERGGCGPAMATRRLGLLRTRGRVAGARGRAARGTRGTQAPRASGPLLAQTEPADRGPSASRPGLEGEEGGESRREGRGGRAPPPFHPTLPRRPGALAPTLLSAAPARRPRGGGSRPRSAPRRSLAPSVRPLHPGRAPERRAPRPPPLCALARSAPGNSRPAHFKGPPSISARPPPRPRTHQVRARARAQTRGRPRAGPRPPDRLVAVLQGPRAGPGVGEHGEARGREGVREPGGEGGGGGAPGCPASAGRSERASPRRGRPGPRPPALPAGLSTRAPPSSRSAHPTSSRRLNKNCAADLTVHFKGAGRRTVLKAEVSAWRARAAPGPPPPPARLAGCCPSPAPPARPEPSGPWRLTRPGAPSAFRPGACGSWRPAALPLPHLSERSRRRDLGGSRARAAPRFMAASASLHFPAPGGIELPGPDRRRPRAPAPPP